MSTRDYAASVLESLNEAQLLDFLRLFADDNTLARIESDMIAAGAEERKHYGSFREILQEIDAEDDDA